MYYIPCVFIMSILCSSERSAWEWTRWHSSYMFLLWRLWNQIITDFFLSYEDQFIELRISEPYTLFYVNKSNIRNLISLKVEIILLEMHKTGAVVLNFKASREVKENRKLISRMNYALSNLFVSVLISETTSVFFIITFFKVFIHHALAWRDQLLVTYLAILGTN